MDRDQAHNRNCRRRDRNPALGITLKAGIDVSKGGTLAHPVRDPLVPISSLRRSNEIDEILRSVLNAPRKEVHAAIETVLKGWPGRWRAELWGRLQQHFHTRDLALQTIGDHAAIAVFRSGIPSRSVV